MNPSFLIKILKGKKNLRFESKPENGLFQVWNVFLFFFQYPFGLEHKFWKSLFSISGLGSKFRNPSFDTPETQNVFNFQLTCVSVIFDFIRCLSRGRDTLNLQLFCHLLLFDAQQQKKVFKPSFSKLRFYANIYYRLYSIFIHCREKIYINI